MSSAIRALQVVRAFEGLVQSVNELSDNLPNCVLLAELCKKNDFKPLHAVQLAVSNLVYDDSKNDGRTLIELPGIVFVTPDGLPFLDDVNQKKALFETACSDFRADLGAQKDAKCRSMQMIELRDALNAAGHRRVHIKQSVRRLVVMNEPVNSIHWYEEAGGWGKQKKLDHDQVRQLVEDNKSHYQDIGYYDIAIRTLNQLPTEEIFARRYKSAPSIKAKITTENATQIVIASMPLFVVVDDVSAIEVIKYQPSIQSAGKTGTKKSRSKFEEEPVIKALNLYRYKPEYR